MPSRTSSAKQGARQMQAAIVQCDMLNLKKDGMTPSTRPVTVHMT